MSILKFLIFVINYYHDTNAYMYSVSIWAIRLALFREKIIDSFIEISGLLGWMKQLLWQTASMAQFMSEKVLCWISY